MPAFPAYCPKCKSIFPCNNFIGIEGNASVTVDLKNNKTNCPICGYAHAKITDAVYSANSTAISVLSAPESSRPIIEAFKELVEKAATGKISSAEAVTQAEKISPKYASVVENFAKLGLPGLMLLAAVITAYLQYDGNVSSSKSADAILNAITQQTLVLKNQHYIPSVESQGAHKPNAKPKQKSSLEKYPSQRRKHVRSERRYALKVRREAFGGSRTH